MDNRTFLIKNFELQIKKYMNFSTSVSEKIENVFFLPYSVRMGENAGKIADQNNSEYGHFFT